MCALEFGKPNGLQTDSHLGNLEDKRVRLGAALESEKDLHPSCPERYIRFVFS